MCASELAIGCARKYISKLISLNITVFRSLTLGMLVAALGPQPPHNALCFIRNACLFLLSASFTDMRNILDWFENESKNKITAQQVRSTLHKVHASCPITSNSTHLEAAKGVALNQKYTVAEDVPFCYPPIRKMCLMARKCDFV